MKAPRRGRTRSIAKWISTVLAALLFVTWIAGTRYSASHTWNVRTDPTPQAARRPESVPFGDLIDFQWLFRYNASYSAAMFRHQIGLAAGRLYFYHDDDDGFGWWTPEDPRWSMRVGFDARIAPARRGFRPAFFALPLWFPVAIIGIPAALLWRTDLRARRLARRNLCTHCRYDLTATAPSTPCPECGKVRPSESGMRAASRWPRNLARICAVLTLLLFAAWIGSAYTYRSLRWNSRLQVLPQPTTPTVGTPGWDDSVWPLAVEEGNEIGICDGRAWMSIAMPIMLWRQSPQGVLELWPVHAERDASTSRGMFISIPLWIPLVIVAIPTTLLWRSGRNEQRSPRRA